MNRLLLPLLLSTVAGCGPDFADEMVKLPAADVAEFAASVQPILARRCANPSCHGNAGRPLALYARHRYRLEPADVHKDLALTEDELRRNVTRILALHEGIHSATEGTLLLKPLAPAAGGASHAGGVVFLETDDTEYQVLQAWLAGVIP